MIDFHAPSGWVRIGNSIRADHVGIYLEPEGPAGDLAIYEVTFVDDPILGAHTSRAELVFTLDRREAAALAYPIANAGGGGIMWPRLVVSVDWGTYGLDRFGNDCALELVRLDDSSGVIEESDSPDARRLIPIVADLAAAAIYEAVGL